MEEKKKMLRQKALSQRKLLPIGIKREKSKKIVESIINSDEYKTNNVFFAYAALEDEVNIDEFIIQALADNKKVFLPRVKKDSMNFYQIESLSDLENGNFNVREPKTYCNKFEENLYKKFYESEKDSDINKTEQIVVYTPGVAFTFKGERMGYGKGYYDRFFAKYPKLLKIGVAFKEQLYETTYSQKYDVFLDKVIFE